MIGLSQTTGYAMQALGCLQNPSCECQSIAHIAECASVPRPYLAKIINALVRANLVRAKRGVGGGISLARPPAQISLLQIVEAVEGQRWLGECLLGMADCTGTGICPTGAFWTRVRKEIIGELNRATLADVIALRTRPRRGRSRHSTPQTECCHEC
ncbi:MAG TPA: Rrf2 family transcriptional regulator [Opitutaceae bacterium]